MDWDFMKEDDPLGEATVDLRNVLQTTRGEPFALLLDDGQLLPGRIYLSVSWVSDGPKRMKGSHIVNVQLQAPSEPVERSVAVKNMEARLAYEQGRKMNQTGTLQLHVSHGTGLLPMDDNGLSDPYARITVGSTELSTRLIKKTLEPKWAEDFDFRGRLRALLSTKLIVNCWDWDFMKDDDFLGQGRCDRTIDATAERRAVGAAPQRSVA